MFRRPWIFPSLVLVFASLAVLPACKKKRPVGDEPPPSDSGGPSSVPGDPPTPVSSEYLLYAHLNAKDIRDSVLVTELKQAITKVNGVDLWNKVDSEAGQEIGVKLTDIESVTVCATEVPPRGEPKVVLILTTNKAINKAAVFRLGPQAKPDSRGFYPNRDGLIHFPDDKTLVLVHPDLAQKYLDGYAKNRSGWPKTAELTKAATGHALFAIVNMQKIPREALNDPGMKELQPLLAAQSVALTADLKGKTITAAARAKFPDAAAAGKAKDLVQQFIKMATDQVGEFMNGKEMASLSALKPVVQESQRTLKDVKLEVSGSDVTLVGSYKADFDFNALATQGVQQVQAASSRMTAENNLKQIGLALHNYHDAYSGVPILGIGPNGAMLRNATDKPLLSWRVAMLPYIEQTNLYKQFHLDEPWDSEHNKKLIDKMPKIYAPVAKPGKPGYTHIQMVVGPNAMQPPSVRFPGSFPDGLSNTIAVVEAAEPVIWTKPDDVMLPGKEVPKDFRKKFGGQFSGGFNDLMWDGSVHFVRDSVSDHTLQSALNPNDGQALGSDW